MATWREIWEGRGLAPEHDPTEDTRRVALELNGYDRATTGAVTPDDFETFARKWAEQVGYAQPESIYEVGCGSGSFLAAAQAVTGCPCLAGCDYSASLVEAGTALFPDLALEVADAVSFPTRPPADHVVSFGVFFYFPSSDYAEKVLRRMQAKARRSVSVLDVPDAATRVQAEDYRRSALGDEDYAARYSGLEHLYLSREWFGERFPDKDWDVEISDQTLPNYGNGRFRYNVLARLRA